MKRAAILIGVHKAKELPTLRAVLDGVRRMEAWARAQGMQDHIRVITDEDEEVTSGDVEMAVVETLETDGLEQLVIYFSGHGVNLGYSEYWLLNRAIQLPSQSVNVSGSVARAKHCGVKHVVLISDACRTPPQTLQQQGTIGTVIFPNVPAGARKSHVDIFYATRLGEPALEIEDTQQPSDTFRAIYTDSLLHALHGRQANICEHDTALNTDVVRPWPLSDYLTEDVPQRVYDLTDSFDRSQVPEAEIGSRPEAWISDVSLGQTDIPPTFSPTPDGREIAEAVRSESTATANVIREVIQEANTELPIALRESRSPGGLESASSSPIADLAANTRRNAETFGRVEFDSKSGFKVRGTRVVEVVSRHESHILDDGQSVEMLSAHQPNSVLLVFESGMGTLTAVLPEFIGSLTLDGERLTDFYFEPSQNSHRWSFFQQRSEELRNLRAVISACTRHGVFRLRGDDARQLARRMQMAKSIDPSLALYAAHAYAAQGNDEWLDEMTRFLRSDLGIVPLDIALLAGRLRDTNTANEKWIAPFLPMLSQTWALLPAFNVELPSALENIQSHLVNSSLWSLYAPEGVALIRNAIETGDLT